MRNHADLSIFETTGVNAKIDARFRLKPRPPGDYTVTVTATGYHDITAAAVTAKLGTNNHLNAALEAI